MTRRDIALSALRHEQSDFVPYSIALAGDGFDAYADRLLKDYFDERVDEDLRKGRISKGLAVSLSIGNHVVLVQPPWWDWHGLGDEFLKADDPPDKLPNTVGRGSYEAFFELLAYLRERYDAYLLAIVYGSHWEKAYFARGIENFLADLAGSPEWAQSLLDMIIRKNLVMLENILDTPDFDGLLLGSDWGTQRDLIMSPKCFREMIKPGEIQEYQLLKRYGKHVFIHSCGDIRRIMPDLVEMGVDALNPVQPECMDIRELKALYGEHITFFGGISTQKTLPYGTPEEVAKETEATIRLLGNHGGYITSPSQEIQADVPYENLRALIDTAREHTIR